MSDQKQSGGFRSFLRKAVIFLMLLGVIVLLVDALGIYDIIPDAVAGEPSSVEVTVLDRDPAATQSPVMPGKDVVDVLPQATTDAPLATSIPDPTATATTAPPPAADPTSVSEQPATGLCFYENPADWLQPKHQFPMFSMGPGLVLRDNPLPDAPVVHTVSNGFSANTVGLAEMHTFYTVFVQDELAELWVKITIENQTGWVQQFIGQRLYDGTIRNAAFLYPIYEWSLTKDDLESTLPRTLRCNS